MNNRRGRMDPDTAERLLSAVPAGTRAGNDPLADLLVAAAAPARPAELAGEHAAVLAFRAARVAAAPPAPVRSRSRTAAGKILSGKAAVMLGVATVGGVAVAVAAASLSGQHQPANPTTTSTASSQPAHISTPTQPGGTPATGPRTSGAPTSAAPTSPTAGGGGTTTTPAAEQLRGLCRAFLAGAGGDHGKALDNPAFARLITAAGGRDKVAAYCAALLASPPHPTGRPTAHPTTHPTGPPSPHPTGRPTGH